MPMPHLTAAAVDAELKAAGIPFSGVSLGDFADRGTWRVVFKSDATPSQRTQAASILGAFDADSGTAAIDEKGLEAEKVLRAVVFWCAQRFGISRAVARNEILTIYRSLT
jgi:hypothetical protein